MSSLFATGRGFRARLCLCLLLCTTWSVTLWIAPWAEASPWQEEDAGGEDSWSDARRQYEAERRSIGDEDAASLFRFGVEVFRAQSEGRAEVDVMEMALRALDRVVEIDPDHREAPIVRDVVSDWLKNHREKGRPDYWVMAFSVIGGLGIFLLGMKHMSDGMQAVAGTRLRRMINAVTNNRFLAASVGTAVTCLVQSSSITTVIVVGLVNSGLMVLHQAIGVIMGANIGTTITGWILVLKIGKYGLPILGISAFFYLFSRRDRWRYIAMTFMGLGMVFFGLTLMKNGFKPMKEVPAFNEAFQWFQATSYLGVLKCAAIGCVLTFLVQSSSATLGITIGLASTGAIPFETAAALVLGENIGTTITAWLASIGTTTVAKRAAYAHVMFNVFGVIWITAIFLVYVKVVGQFVEARLGSNPIGLSDDAENYAQIVTLGIASVHTGFNVVNTLLFLPFVRVFARVLERMVPERGVKEAPKLTRLDMRMVESPILAIENSRGEIVKMGVGAAKMMDWTKEVITSESPDDAVVQKVFHREKIMDNVQQEVIEFLTEVLTGEAPHSAAAEARSQLRAADEYESISDYVSLLLKAHLRLDQAGLRLEQAELDSITALHDRVSVYLAMIQEGFEHDQDDIMSRAQTEGDAITSLVKTMRESHLSRLGERKVDPVLSMSYSTMLNAYRKIKDHALNVAEAVAGGKVTA